MPGVCEFDLGRIDPIHELVTDEIGDSAQTESRKAWCIVSRRWLRAFNTIIDTSTEAPSHEVYVCCQRISGTA